MANVLAFVMKDGQDPIARSKILIAQLRTLTVKQIAIQQDKLPTVVVIQIKDRANKLNKEKLTAPAIQAAPVKIAAVPAAKNQVVKKAKVQKDQGYNYGSSFSVFACCQSLLVLFSGTVGERVIMMMMKKKMILK